MSGKHGSGDTHIRYGHVTRPTEIHLVCPRCSGCAIAAQPSRALGKLTAGDCTPGWSEPWNVVCQSCVYRAFDLDWAAMREVGPLFLRTEVSGVELWAWNRAHLEMLAQVLDRGDATGHPLRYFATYMHREWLLKSRRAAFSKAAKKLLLAAVR